MALLITDPVGIKLTLTGEIDRSSGRSRLVAGTEGYVQTVHVKMQMIRGDLFYNLAAGVPYVARKNLVTEAEAILGQKFDVAKAQAAFSAPIIDTPGFAELLSLTFDFVTATRKLGVNWSARTIWGDTAADTLERTL